MGDPPLYLDYLMNYDPENYGVSDPEHIEHAFTGLIDSIDGNESMNLSKSQLYIYSILEVNKDITRAQQVAGNESFFGAIGSGLQAIWDFIAKIFKGIYNFFFGGGDGSIDSKEKTAIAQVESDTEILKRLQANSEQRKKEAAEVKAADNKAAADAQEVKNKKWQKETDEWNQMNNQRHEQRGALVAEAEKASGLLTALVESSNHDKYKDTPFDSMYFDLQTVLKNMRNVERDASLTKGHDVKNIMDAIEASTKTSSYLGKMSAARQPMMRTKFNLQSDINDLERKVKAAKKDDPSMPKLKKDLQAAKDFLQEMAKFHKYLEETIDVCLKYSRWLKANYKM